YLKVSEASPCVSVTRQMFSCFLNLCVILFKQTGPQILLNFLTTYVIIKRFNQSLLLVSSLNMGPIKDSEMMFIGNNIMKPSKESGGISESSLFWKVQFSDLSGSRTIIHQQLVEPYGAGITLENLCQHLQYRVTFTNQR
ncbi:hypothetical protein GOODEAATRI_006170, partial [Goodea atripinnis]